MYLNLCVKKATPRSRYDDFCNEVESSEQAERSAAMKVPRSLVCIEPPKSYFVKVQSDTNSIRNTYVRVRRCAYTTRRHSMTHEPKRTT